MDNLPRLDYSHSRDQLLMDLAAMQHRVVRHVDLFAIGFTRSAIAAARRADRLFHKHEGVYAIGTPDLDVFGLALAAVFALGNAVLSHRSAAWMWGFLRYDGVPEVTAASYRRPREGMVIHQTQSLREGDVRIWKGIPVTSPERTLIDLADVLEPDPLDQALSEAHFRGFVDRTVPNRPGRRAVSKRRLTRSQLERAYLARLRQASVRRPPETNVMIGEYEADAYYREEGVVIEFDDYRSHGDERTFQRDRAKGNDYLLRGLRLARVTEETLDEAAELTRRLLAAAPR